MTAELSFTATPQDADDAQQAFSSDQGPSLHLTIPALEALYKAWSEAREDPVCIDFVEALDAGLAKVDEYYHRTASSDAYTFAMCTLTFFIFADNDADTAYASSA